MEDEPTFMTPDELKAITKLIEFADDLADVEVYITVIDSDERDLGHIYRKDDYYVFEPRGNTNG